MSKVEVSLLLNEFSFYDTTAKNLKINKVKIGINNYADSMISINADVTKLKYKYDVKKETSKESNFELVEILKYIKFDKIKLKDSYLGIMYNNGIISKFNNINTSIYTNGFDLFIESKGSLNQGDYSFKIDGDLKQVNNLDIDIEIKSVKLSQFNTILIKEIPIDITKGELTIFLEYKKNRGYIKVFLDNTKILKKDQDYVGDKHFIYEYISAFGVWALENDFTENVAVRVPFVLRDNELDIDKSDATFTALKNVFDSLDKKFDKNF